MDNKSLLTILAVVFPPIAVYLASEGHQSQMRRLIISIVLSIVFYIPGIIYALDIVLDQHWFYDKLDA